MKDKNSEKKNGLVDIKPGVASNYQQNQSMMPGSHVPSNVPQIDFNALKDKLENFKKAVVKKYAFTMALVMLPSQAYPLFEEDEALPKEVVESKPLHLIMIIPEEQYKNIPKIKPEVVKLAKETKENIWVSIKTELDLWNYGLDSKYELLDATAQGYPIYDKGFLGALRVASIHKSLVLRKFDKYVATYVIAGSLVRGTAGKDSDVDVFVIIDDTDVKRMSRVELLERLRGMIHEYIREATALAGVKNILNVQVYLLTDFWQSVKDAHPVMFTFIRDGIPLWDRGTFIPWKLLLKMGKIKPSPEAIDLYMKQGEQTQDFVKRRLLDAMVDIYYGILTPTQSMTMLAGEGPEVPKNIVAQVRRLFLEKEELMDEKNLKILEKAVHLFKQYEYGKLKEYPGKDLDVFLKECLEYNKMLKELRTKLEKRVQEKSIEEVYEEVFKLLKTIFGDKSQSNLIKEFENKMVKKGKMQSRFSNVLKELISVKGKVKSGKLNQKDADNVKREAFDLMEALVEYAQRADLVQAKKGVMQVSYNGRKSELLLLGEHNFLIEEKEIKKIENGKLVVVKESDFQKIFNENKAKLTTKVSGEVFSTLKKVLGDFEIEF
jgi:predicted nucleotidyltransferase